MNKTTLRKIVTRSLALLLAGTMTITDLGVDAMASTASAASMISTVSTSQDLYVQTLGAENAGSILDKGFDRTQMTKEEKQKFDEALEESYQQNKQVAKENNWTKKEYKENMEKLLNGSMEVEEAEDGKLQMYSTETVILEGGKKAKKKKKHGWLSVGALGSMLNFILSLAIGSAGFGSLKAMVTRWGKDKAREWVKTHVRRAVIDKVKFLVGVKAAKAAGTIVLRIINTCLDIDPGLWIAKEIDKRDKMPSNGYIEIFKR